ncbi:HD domain-containing protein [Halobacillus yeomjeoni]|uniref:HD domain-containing phosphohydrolase n=1 Tax=Halobacillus yeomjeoni TaxID=311194 RepID=UPI001CD29567|nr:HD domain-containing phosphohydrolase [Halobacillus yeomjeoni]MCA0984225.1 HD domain-containing protein [Halobacillus yeomjeoni]
MIPLTFTIGRNGEHLEQVVFEHFDISLLSRGGGTEVMVQTITKDHMFYVYPSDNPGVMEFFYILSGEMICEWGGEKIKLGPGDHYTAYNLEEAVHFTTLSDVVYLWVINEPTFYQLSEEVLNLKKVVDEVEKKDRYTYKHSERVAEYAIKIAKKLMLPKGRLEQLYLSSILHDIGKIHTPIEVLNKPGRLTDEEFGIIKRHPVDGAEMVKGLYHDEISKIILQHHERLNGTGYPNRISGEDILFEAKIIAVSDTFDAMTEDRAYRKALTAQFALDELKKLKGTHYDTEVVDAFENILIEEKRV